MGKKTLSTLLVLIMVVALPCIAAAKDFKDVSAKAGVADDGLGKGVAFADIIPNSSRVFIPQIVASTVVGLKYNPAM